MRYLLSVLLVFLALSCSFEYGNVGADTQVFPDITMEDLEYTRIRGGHLSATLTAEIGERYEPTHTMSLTNYTFKQYESSKETIDAEGVGGQASIELVQNNIKMSQGVSIRIDSEDFAVETMSLEWQDKTKTLKGGDNMPVNLSRSDGTELSGSNFHANIRDRTWVFGSNVHGVYVDDGDDDKNTTATGATIAEKPEEPQNDPPAETTTEDQALE